MLIPMLAMLGLVYLMLKSFQSKENKALLLELQKTTKQQTLPLRLQAYERLVLLTERLEPAALFTRLSADAQSAGALEWQMLLAIKQEFEHNLSQQIYVSPAVWAQLVKAKQQLLDIVHQAAKKIPKDASPQDFGKALFSHLEQQPPRELLIAKSALREEAGLLVGIR